MLISLAVTKDTRLCSVHLEPDCFERDLRAELPDRKGKRKLKPDAVPTIFDHRPRKKPWLSTEQRLLEISEKRGKNKTFHYIQPGAFKQGMKTHATAAH